MLVSVLRFGKYSVINQRRVCQCNVNMAVMYSYSIVHDDMCFVKVTFKMFIALNLHTEYSSRCAAVCCACELRV